MRPLTILSVLAASLATVGAALGIQALRGPCLYQPQLVDQVADTPLPTLGDGDTIDMGTTAYWLQGEGEPPADEDVEVELTGDVDAVTASWESAVLETTCGEASAWNNWVNVTGQQEGTVTLDVTGDWDPGLPKPIELVVTAGR